MIFALKYLICDAIKLCDGAKLLCNLYITANASSHECIQYRAL
jgi:hypothetical protein